MDLECLTWIPHIWDELVGLFIFCKKWSSRPLPDDVTIEILSRLSADCVLECRRVCRKWRSLTSSPSFAELHLKRSTTYSPSLFLHWINIGPLKKVGELNFFIYDKVGQEANTRRRRSIITKVLSGSAKEMYHYDARVVGSCDGLLLFLKTNPSKRRTAFVFNPITQELITVPTPFRHTTPCGIYFHPSTFEYKLLVCEYKGGNPQCYYTCNLKLKVWEKLNYSSSCNTRDDAVAVPMNRSLHWMVDRNEVNNDIDPNVYDRPCTDGIMVFGIETEDFRVLPHPGDACYYRPEEHENMHLLGTRDHLCLCHVSWGEVVHVWVLEDYAKWAWDRRYKVNLDWDVKRFPFDNKPDNSPSYHPKCVKVFGIHSDELFIYWKARGVFSYNLEQKTVSKVVIKVEGPRPYASAYTKSLVSLSDISSGADLFKAAFHQ